MTRKYLQTGNNPSPISGGATELAVISPNNPVVIGGAAPPTAGQVLTATNATTADWETPIGGGLVDDPTVQTVSFTAVANTRYYLDSNTGFIQVTMPTSPSPAEGDLVGVDGTGSGIQNVQLFAPATIRTPDGATSTNWSLQIRGSSVVLRYTSGVWDFVEYSPYAALSLLALNSLLVSSSGAGVHAVSIAQKTVLGRDSNTGVLAALTAPELWSVLYSSTVLVDSNSTQRNNYQGGATLGEWWDATLLIFTPTAATVNISGFAVDVSQTRFVRSKVIFNASTTNYVVLTWDDTSSIVGYRIYFPESLNDKLFIPPLGSVTINWSTAQNHWLVEGITNPPDQQTLTAATTITYSGSLGLNAIVTLNQAGHTLAFSNITARRGIIIVKQDATGARTITSYTISGGTVKFVGGVAPVLSAGANAQDVLQWYFDGTNIYLTTYGLLFS